MASNAIFPIEQGLQGMRLGQPGTARALCGLTRETSGRLSLRPESRILHAVGR